MVVVGLTGKACSGKNVIAGMLADKGWRIVDVDKLGHPILQQAADEVRRDFGPETIGPDGVVNRKALGVLVFADPSKLKTLEAITHPRMVAECKRIIAEETASGGQVVVLNAALLSRMHLDGLCDLVVFVRVPWYIRYRRAQMRDGMDLARFRNRDASQKDIAIDTIAPGRKVVVLDNAGSLESIHRQVAALCDTITQAMGKDWQV
jgi:dephospho-CoA kinase